MRRERRPSGAKPTRVAEKSSGPLSVASGSFLSRVRCRRARIWKWSPLPENPAKNPAKRKPPSVQKKETKGRLTVQKPPKRPKTQTEVPLLR